MNTITENNALWFDIIDTILIWPNMKLLIDKMLRLTKETQYTEIISLEKRKMNE